MESNQKEWQLDKGRLISTQIAIYVDSLGTQVVSIAGTFAVGAAEVGFAERIVRRRADRSIESFLRRQTRVATPSAWRTIRLVSQRTST